jgi:hypothetical protein
VPFVVNPAVVQRAIFSIFADKQLRQAVFSGMIGDQIERLLDLCSSVG